MVIGMIGLVPLVVCVLIARALADKNSSLTVGPRRRFVLIVLMAGLLSGLVVFVVGNALATSMLGLVQMLAPGVGALVILGAIIVSPGTGDHGLGGEAELTPRGWSSLGPGWLYAAPGVAAAAMVLAIVFFGVSSSPDERGLHRSITIDSGFMSGSAGPYPGWYYGFPALVLAALLLAATVVALARVAHHPLRCAPDERAGVLIWRSALARVVMAVGTGSFLLYTGAMTLMAGIATASVTGGSATVEDGQMVGWDLPVLDALSALEVGLGACAILLGLYLCVSAVMIAARR